MNCARCDRNMAVIDEAGRCLDCVDDPTWCERAWVDRRLGQQAAGPAKLRTERTYTKAPVSGQYVMGTEARFRRYRAFALTRRRAVELLAELAAKDHVGLIK